MTNQNLSEFFTLMDVEDDYTIAIKKSIEADAQSAWEKVKFFISKKCDKIIEENNVDGIVFEFPDEFIYDEKIRGFQTKHQFPNGWERVVAIKPLKVGYYNGYFFILKWMYTEDHRRYEPEKRPILQMSDRSKKFFYLMDEFLNIGKYELTTFKKN